MNLRTTINLDNYCSIIITFEIQNTLALIGLNKDYLQSDNDLLLENSVYKFFFCVCVLDINFTFKILAAEINPEVSNLSFPYNKRNTQRTRNSVLDKLFSFTHR